MMETFKVTIAVYENPYPIAVRRVTKYRLRRKKLTSFGSKVLPQNKMTGNQNIEKARFY